MKDACDPPFSLIDSVREEIWEEREVTASSEVGFLNLTCLGGGEDG